MVIKGYTNKIELKFSWVLQIKLASPANSKLSTMVTVLHLCCYLPADVEIFSYTLK